LIGDQNPLEEALESLHQAVASALGNSDGVRLSAIKGTPEKALLAATEAAQLLVLGTSHPGRVSGAISDRLRPPPVAHQISCPVVLIPAHAREELLQDQ
ncbi:MAG TPA: hypothetical protein VI138_06405, partial [Candidatus Dormibacteraeota bacterium]